MEGSTRMSGAAIQSQNTSNGASQMTVFKLDNSGVFFSNGSAEHEFEYTAGGGGPSFITETSQASTYGEGIQIFGTDISGGSYDTYMVKAYYNGKSGALNCSGNEVVNNWGPSQIGGPSTVNTPPINMQQGLSDYLGNDFQVKGNFFAGDFSIVNQLCSAPSVAGGNNARLINGMTETNAGIHTLISPNPSSSFVDISFSTQEAKVVEICIINIWGQCVRKLVKSLNEGFNSLRLGVQDLAEGCYTIKIQLGDLTSTTKLVVSR